MNVALLSIFPFDFSVIPNVGADDVVATWVKVVLILMVVFYGTTALVQFIRLRRYMARQETG